MTKNHHHEIQIYTDGGSRKNPGPSASGFVLKAMDGSLIEAGGAYLGITTNNQAEYQAVKMALERALELQARVIHIYMDSLLVCNQLTGIYKIRNRDLWPIYSNIKELLEKFESYTIEHVYRDKNTEADREVNRILDAEMAN